MESIEEKTMTISYFDDKLIKKLYWLNEPSDWSISDGKLVIKPEKTDFWQKTHYGFEVDNGHCLLLNTKQRDFILTTEVSNEWKHQYDQAGLIIRIDKDTWIKTSCEYEDEHESKLGAVVTNYGYSDWSTKDHSNEHNQITYKITKKGKDFIVETSLQPTKWTQIRIAHLHYDQQDLLCGIYACSPIAPGFVAQFHHFNIQYTD
jgi:uncharacterized protein